jgi:hypothetical protein
MKRTKRKSETRLMWEFLLADVEYLLVVLAGIALMSVATFTHGTL